MYHDLIDAGWRGRMLARHLAVMTPVCAALALLPGTWWMRVFVPVLALLGSGFAVVVSAVEIRASRLRQHGLPVPPRSPRGPAPPPPPPSP